MPTIHIINNFRHQIVHVNLFCHLIDKIKPFQNVITWLNHVHITGVSFWQPSEHLCRGWGRPISEKKTK
jgi:hypothetical protein